MSIRFLKSALRSLEPKDIFLIVLIGDGGFEVFVYVLLIAIATPYVTFISMPPSLSALYALLFISFFILRAGQEARS
mgnify:FL=1